MFDPLPPQARFPIPPFFLLIQIFCKKLSCSNLPGSLRRYHSGQEGPLTFFPPWLLVKFLPIAGCSPRASFGDVIWLAALNAINAVRTPLFPLILIQISLPRRRSLLHFLPALYFRRTLPLFASSFFARAVVDARLNACSNLRRTLE